MGFFPTDAEDLDEVGPNANGTYFKYNAADNKWVIINTLVVSDVAYDEGTWNGNTDAATKNAIRDEIESMVFGDTKEVSHAYVEANELTLVKDLNMIPASGTGVALLLESSEDASITLIGDTDNDDETKHAWMSFFQDGVARFLHIGVGKEDDDNEGFITVYEKLLINIGALGAGTPIITLDTNGITLATNKAISFDAEQNDTKHSGIVIDIDTTGCNNFDLVYIDAADSVAPADASDDTKMPAIGIVVAVGKVLVHGVVKDDDLIVCTTGGAVVYASTTLRKVTETSPNAAGNMIQVVGVCVGDHSLYVNVSLDMVEFVV